MLLPRGSSFHPNRGIGQGDTPSTLIFIAAFDVLLTLLEADDLVYLAPSLPAQQYQADLVCGFCAYTGLEISVLAKWKLFPSTTSMAVITPHTSLYTAGIGLHTLSNTVTTATGPAILAFTLTSIPVNGISTRQTPTSNLSVKSSNRNGHLHAKLLVYTLCLKSQIRHPAGLAPWTLAQYQDTRPPTPANIWPPSHLLNLPHLRPPRSWWLWWTQDKRTCPATEMVLP
jgi:hypothetical protein